MNKAKALKIFKALGEETRFLIIEQLLKNEMCACEIPLNIDRTQSNTSMHLAKLQDLGFITSKRNGKSIVYSIADEDIRTIMKLIKNK